MGAYSIEEQWGKKIKNKVSNPRREDRVRKNAIPGMSTDRPTEIAGLITGSHQNGTNKD